MLLRYIGPTLTLKNKALEEQIVLTSSCLLSVNFLSENDRIPPLPFKCVSPICWTCLGSLILPLSNFKCVSSNDVMLGSPLLVEYNSSKIFGYTRDLLIEPFCWYSTLLIPLILTKFILKPKSNEDVIRTTRESIYKIYSLYKLYRELCISNIY